MYGFKTFLVCVSNPQSEIRLADELGQHLILRQLALGNEADKHNSIMTRLRGSCASGEESHRLYLGLSLYSRPKRPCQTGF
ncbi:MAG: hypothetical protein SRB2_04407 [Desulfobacteraceae bacterium Eth-SRB2]|nr:MAG: hypothetical protein SRB2_04407 [Desulfobacteraceae bacterium Eth-SRB2]